MDNLEDPGMRGVDRALSDVQVAKGRKRTIVKNCYSRRDGTSNRRGRNTDLRKTGYKTTLLRHCDDVTSAAEYAIKTRNSLAKVFFFNL